MNTLIYQANRNIFSDDLIVIERTEENRFLTSIVSGNYPVDYLSKYEAEFGTEEMAEAAADAVRDGKVQPGQVMREL